eukprot:14653487-Heterocapsa_arctica.AAC.1
MSSLKPPLLLDSLCGSTLLTLLFFSSSMTNEVSVPGLRCLLACVACDRSISKLLLLYSEAAHHFS